MKPPVLSLSLVLLLVAPQAAPYSASRDGDVVRLVDASRATSVSIVPSIGNIVFAVDVKGQNILNWPYASLDAFKAKPAMTGLPFMGPWANRLDEQAFYANGRRYAFDMDMGNVRGERPIHGFLSTTDQWRLLDVTSDRDSAWATSRLEFFRHPSWMRQFPFAHTIQMTHRLRDGVVQVSTRIHNQSAEPMPLAVGFHPCYRLTDSARDAWTVSVGARTRWLLAPTKLPTGETEPIERLLPDPRNTPLEGHNLDDVFSDLVRDAEGRATASVRGASQQIDVAVDRSWRALVIYAPADRDFVCLEPMAGITNAMNLAHRGLYKDLQSLPAGHTWEATFWVKPYGF